MTAANDDHAAQLVEQADAAMRQRKALLCASVVLCSTSNVAAARKLLRGYEGQPVVVTDAMEILDGLSKVTR